jgi:hypothetical protein
VLVVTRWHLLDPAHRVALLAPVKTGPPQPGFDAFRYTLDLLLPVANLKQRDDAFTPSTVMTHRLAARS